MKKIILVTGASSGFGADIARECIKDGHTLILSARREERLVSLKEELVQNGALKQDIHIIPSDIKNTDFICDTLSKLGFKKIDVLINNAGLALGLSSFEDTNKKDIDTMIETNVLALVHLTRALLPAMVESKSGQIINIGSIAGRYPYPGGNIYGATKAFIRQFSLNLRSDLYEKGIRVSNVEPGLVGESEFSLVRFGGDRQKADNVYKDTTPLKSKDIANIVRFIINTPEHVNINTIEIMPTIQAPAALNVAKTKGAQ